MTEEQETLVKEELNEIDDVESAEITKEHDCLKIVTKDNQFEDVMSQAVNICRRVAQGTELSFARFAV